MKIQGFQKTGLAMVAAAATVALLAANVFAQDASAPAATPLSPAAAQVLQLSQAKISDNTIITFVQNSGSAYGLTASQIVYLKQQGVSETVINVMLNQHPAAVTVAQPAPMDNTSSGTASTATATVAQPSTPAPDSSSVYVVPDTQTYYYDNWAYPYYYPYYPYYGYYGWPTVSFYWGHPYYYGGFRGGWGGSWHGGGSWGGGGWRGGGGGGGFHGGGGWHR